MNHTKTVIKEIHPSLAKENIENLNALNLSIVLVQGFQNELENKTERLLAMLRAEHSNSEVFIDLMALHIVTTKVRHAFETWLISQESENEEQFNMMFA